MAITLTGSFWYGHEASEYAKESGYLDYGTFSDAFAHILNNDIINFEGAEFYCITDNEYDEETDSYMEVFQYYIVPEWAVEEILKDAGEIVYYSEPLGVYLWGVTHYGTPWESVLTDIKINCDKEA